jgi:superfamily I DNA/RNA helicase
MDSGAGGASSNGNTAASPSDIAVLVRITAMAAPIIKALNDHGIPYNAPEASWIDDDNVKLILQYLEKNQAWRHSSNTPEEIIRQAFEAVKSDSSIAKKNVKKSTPEPVERLIQMGIFFNDISATIDNLCISQGIHGGSGFDLPIALHGVRILTIHASKGLEFEHVFVAGLEEGMLPFTLYEDAENIDAGYISEEQRLLYVAMTRARTGLWLSHAASRYFRGRLLKAPASRFLSDLGSLVPLVKDERVYKKDAQMNLF